MRAYPSLLFAGVLLLSAGTSCADALVPTEVRARVDHHLRRVEQLTAHFEAMLTASCPVFPNREGWDAYVETEANRLVLLIAHLEEAWIEAKRSPDDEIRRAAKAPKRQSEHARQLVEKLRYCAELNGATLAPGALWRRIEREVPQRQAEIALPR